MKIENIHFEPFHLSYYAKFATLLFVLYFNDLIWFFNVTSRSGRIVVKESSVKAVRHSAPAQEFLFQEKKLALERTLVICLIFHMQVLTFSFVSHFIELQRVCYLWVCSDTDKMIFTCYLYCPACWAMRHFAINLQAKSKIDGEHS